MCVISLSVILSVNLSPSSVSDGTIIIALRLSLSPINEEKPDFQIKRGLNENEEIPHLIVFQCTQRNNFTIQNFNEQCTVFLCCVHDYMHAYLMRQFAAVQST